MVSRYKCHLCEKNFSWCYTLTLHLRKKHQLKWPSGHSRFRYAAHLVKLLVDSVVCLNLFVLKSAIVTWVCTVGQSVISTHS